MKKTIFLMAMLLALSAAAPMASAAPQSHRNRPHTQMVDKKDKKAADEAEGIVAYSDTVTADTASAANGGATFDNDAPVSRDELLEFYNSLPGWIVKLFLIVCVFVPMLLCFLAPIIVVLLVIRYFMRRHKDRVRLTEDGYGEGRTVQRRTETAQPEVARVYVAPRSAQYVDWCRTHDFLLVLRYAVAHGHRRSCGVHRTRTDVHGEVQLRQ